MSFRHIPIVIFALFVGSALWADGPADDCSFIREKINAMSETGGEIIIPRGVYTCLTPIILNRSHIHLRGDGEVQLHLGNGANSPLIIMGDAAPIPRPLEDIQVRDVKIDGNRWYQKYECWGGPCDSGGTSFIRNNGITIRAVTKGEVQNVSVSGARSGGLVTEKGCFDLNIDHFSAVDSEFDGFAGYETSGARMTHLTLANNRAAGISLDIRFHGNFFNDVQIADTGDVGIFVRYANSNIFENVTVTNSGNHGVFLAQADDASTCPEGNEFQNLSVTHSRGIGFLLNNRCEKNRLTGTTTLQQNRDGCIGDQFRALLEIEGPVSCQN